MRTHRYVPTIAAIIALATPAAPAFAADADVATAGGTTATGPAHHQAPPADWLIAAGAGCGVLLIGASTAGSRRAIRRTRIARRAPAASRP
ncbi:MAG: hypothetical protein ACLP01_02190 [Solirubrobacteraceae bacterium]